MKIFGIVAEYNPFHNGHLWQIEETRRLGATHIVAVMSGNFVQRGEPAIADKFLRAELAVRNGADLVLELPVSYALSSAEFFARGAVSILGSLGCVDGISFGSECGDVSLLKTGADASARLASSPRLKSMLEDGTPYPAALQRLTEAEYGAECAEIFSHPNNLLGIEYLKAVNALNLDFEILTIPRKSAAHDSETASGNIASASLIRALMRSGKDFSALVPENASGALSACLKEGNSADISRLEQAVLYRMRSLSPDEAKRLPDVSHGLENRLINEAQKACSLEELLFAVKTKRYPMAKIRRVLMNALIGTEKSDLKVLPPYGRILAFNSRGCEIIKTARKTAEFPIDTSLARLEQTGEAARRFAENEVRAGNIYALAQGKIHPSGADYTQKITKSQ